MYVLPWRGGMQMARFRGPSGQGAGHPLRNRLKNTAVERAHNARLARQDAVARKNSSSVGSFTLFLLQNLVERVARLSA